MSRSIKIDQVADAFVSVPGVTLSILAGQAPTVTETVNAAVYENINTNYTDISVSIPVSGLYMLQLGCGGIYATGGAEVRFRILDGVTPITTDDKRWEFSLHTDRESTLLQEHVELTAGAHTLTIQWQRAAGSGDVTIDTPAHLDLRATLISGSGAGGILPDQAILAATFTTSVPHTTWQDADNGGGDALSLTIDAVEGESVLVLFHSSTQQNTASGTAYCRLVLNGTPIAETQIGDYTYYSAANNLLVMPHLVRDLVAGSNTIKVQVRNSTANSMSLIWEDSVGDTARGKPTLQIVRFRGGLVPWERDGVQVLDTPRAINIIGGAMGVSDDGSGKLNIELPTAVTATGVTVVLMRKIPAATYTTTSESFVDVDASIADTFEIVNPGLYMLDISLDQVHSATGTNGRYRLVIDAGTAEEQIVIADDAEANFQVSSNGNRTWRTFHLPVTLTAGSHTIKPQWYRQAGSATISVSVGSVFEVIGTLVSGSGAGGTIVTSDTQTETPIDYTGAVWQFMDRTSGGIPIEVVFDASTDEQIIATCSFTTVNVGSNVEWADYRLILDEGLATEQILSGNRVAYRDGSHDTPVVLTGISAALSAGSHNIRVQVYVNGALTVRVAITANRPNILTVVQSRGGLIPVRKDGVTLTDKPQALNFVGHGASVSGGTVNIEMNEAITTPGAQILVIGEQPATDIALTGSYAAFMPTTGSLSVEVPVAGTYLVQWSGPLAAGASGTSIRVKLVLDEGESYEQTLGDGLSWQTRVAPTNYMVPTFYAQAVLTAGTHTLIGYAKEAVGTEGKVIGTASVVVGEFTTSFSLVSGSGAGGVITASIETNPAHTPQTISSLQPTYTDLTVSSTDSTPLSHSINTAEGEDVLVVWTGGTRNVDGSSNPIVGIKVDGVLVHAVTNNQGVSTQHTDQSFTFLVRGLSSGTHTIKMVAAKTISVGHTFKIEPTPLTGYNPTEGCSFQVLQFRGGLVPIRKDGVTVTDKPQAWDFVGPGAQVTNVGGTAKIALMGAEGLETSTSLLSADFSEAVVANVFEDIPNLDPITVTTAEGEYVLVTFSGGIVCGSSSIDTFARLMVDSTPYPAQYEAGVYTKNLSFSQIVGPLPAGLHTIKAQMAAHVNTTLTGYVVYSATSNNTRLMLSVTRFRGGYVHPENVPVLEYSSASQVRIVAAPGASSELRVLFNDGSRYTAQSPLALDLTVSGLGGLDTGSEASNTWYYVYTVPGAVAGTLDVVGSVTDPSTGPTGYPVWSYLGFFRNDGSSNIKPFDYRAVGVYRQRSSNDSDILIYHLSAAAPTEDAWVNISPAAVAIPVPVAGAVTLEGALDSDSGGSFKLHVEPGNPPSFTPTNWNGALLCGQDSGQYTATRTIPLFDGTISAYWESRVGNVDLDIIIREVYDKYLTVKVGSSNIPSGAPLPRTTIVTVDGNRTDSYVEDGSIARPYKTINTALTAITDNDSDHRYVINIAPATYDEQITCKDAVDLVGASRNGVRITNSTAAYTVRGTSDIATIGARVDHLYIENTSMDGYSILLSNSASMFITDCTIYSTNSHALCSDNADCSVRSSKLVSDTSDAVHAVTSGEISLEHSFLDGYNLDIYTDVNTVLHVDGALQTWNWTWSINGVFYRDSTSSFIGNNSQVYGNDVTEALNQLYHFVNVAAYASTPVNLDFYSDGKKVFTNEGATAQIVFNLPEAYQGRKLTFIVQNINGIKVVAASGDTIRVAGTATGNITSSTVGDVITLVAINSTDWIATSYVGTWTVT